LRKPLVKRIAPAVPVDRQVMHLGRQGDFLRKTGNVAGLSQSSIEPRTSADYTAAPSSLFPVLARACLSHQSYDDHRNS
jgi:hypothetical protein